MTSHNMHFRLIDTEANRAKREWKAKEMEQAAELGDIPQ